MFNEMRRPCTLPASWKQPNGRPIEPFDAMDYLYYELKCSSNSIGSYEILLFKSTGVLRRATFCCGEGKGDYYDYVLPAAKIECHLLSLVIAQALNPLIEVTQAVLKAMEEVPEAKFWVWDDESKYLLEWQGVWEYESKNDSWQNGRDFDDEGIPSHSKLQLGDYIQADCPLALQVLFQFNTQGELL